MRRWITNAVFGMFAVWMGLLCPHMAVATDIPIFPTGQVFKLNNLTWGQSGASGFNNSYFFTPIIPSGSACIYIYNNNPTNAHTFNATLTATANQSQTTPSDGTWITVPTTAGISGGLAPVSPGLPVLFSSPISGFAQISINLSGSTPLGGIPDTASVVILQTSGVNCSGPPAINDPCASYGFIKSQIPITQSGTGVISIITHTGNRVTFVCGYTLGVTGTAPTIQFLFGTGSNCGTGISNISGVIPILTASNITTATNAMQFAAPAANDICLQLGGTTPTAGGYITYVQQ